jgi:transposase-like protein
MASRILPQRKLDAVKKALQPGASLKEVAAETGISYSHLWKMVRETEAQIEYLAGFYGPVPPLYRQEGCRKAGEWSSNQHD